MARDTVAVDTPASLATSSMVSLATLLPPLTPHPARKNRLRPHFCQAFFIRPPWPIGPKNRGWEGERQKMPAGGSGRRAGGEKGRPPAAGGPWAPRTPRSRPGLSGRRAKAPAVPKFPADWPVWGGAGAGMGRGRITKEARGGPCAAIQPAVSPGQPRRRRLGRVRTGRAARESVPSSSTLTGRLSVFNGSASPVLHRSDGPPPFPPALDRAMCLSLCASFMCSYAELFHCNMMLLRGLRI